MKQTVAFLSFIIVILIVSCQQGPSPLTGATKYLNRNNLRDQLFSINTERDTVISTREGIRISIAAHAIQASAPIVTLQVKEVLKAEDIFLSGLTTVTADKNILSSAGMFYINTKEPSFIRKPLRMSVPAEYTDSTMQLYKGNEKNDTITWQSPVPLVINDTINHAGEALFTENCASCHGINKAVTGPPLAWIENRFNNTKLLYQYIRDNQAVLRMGNPHACCVYNKYGKLAMNLFPALSDQDMDNLVHYINKQSIKFGVPRSFNPDGDCDSANYYRAAYFKLAIKRDSLMFANGDSNNTTVLPPPPPDASLPPPVNTVKKEEVSHASYEEAYQFTVAAYGWYNIDALLDGRAGVVTSILKVQMQFPAALKPRVFMAIPEDKVFMEGYPTGTSQDFVFKAADGTIPLPQGHRAYVFAIGQHDERVFFGQASFTASILQIESIPLRECTAAFVIKAIANMQLNAPAEKALVPKYYEDAKSVDKDMNYLVDKLKNCTCTVDTSLTTPKDTIVPVPLPVPETGKKKKISK